MRDGRGRRTNPIAQFSAPTNAQETTRMNRNRWALPTSIVVLATVVTAAACDPKIIDAVVEGAGGACVVDAGAGASCDSASTSTSTSPAQGGASQALGGAGGQGGQ